MAQISMISQIYVLALSLLRITGSNSEIASRSTGSQTTKDYDARYAFGSTTENEIMETTEHKDTSIGKVIHTRIGYITCNISEDEDSTNDHVSFTTFSHKGASVGTQLNIAHFWERDTTIGDGKLTISNGALPGGLLSSSVTTTLEVPSNSETTSSPTPEETTAHYIPTQPTDDIASSSTDIHWQQKAAEDTFTYVSPILIVSGTVGNALSAIVLQNHLFRSSSTGFILTALAVLDVGVVNTGLMRFWLIYAFNTEIRDLSSFSCKFHNLLTYYLRQLASWTLILLTIERSVAVCCPLRCRELCSKRRILLSWFSIAVLLFAANSFFFVSFDLFTKVENSLSGNNTTNAVFIYVCNVRSEWFFFYENQWCWIDAFLGDFFPAAVVLIGNIITVNKIMHSRNARLRQLGSTSLPKEKMASTTAMLIGVSLLFLVLTLPLDAFIIYYAYRGTSTLSDLDQAIYNFGYAVVTIFYYASNALDFLIYLVSGRKFRQALLETFLPCRKITSGNAQTANHMRGAAVEISYIGSQPGTQSA